MRTNWLGVLAYFISGLAMVGGVIALASFVFLLLWNNVVTEAVPICAEITFLQAVGLVFFTGYIRQPNWRFYGKPEDN